MTKSQKILIGAIFIAFQVFNFGCESSNTNQESIEPTSVKNAEPIDINTLLEEAKSKLTSAEADSILVLEERIEKTKQDSTKSRLMKKIAGSWYLLKRPDISGIYAEKIAEIDNNEEAWSITGTTFSIGVQRLEEQKIRDYCTKKAIKAFEKAISLNPENINHRTNLALCYTENPIDDSPMKGILMLRELVEKHPDNVRVLLTLGRLAIRTGQFEKAKERLEHAYSVEANNPEVVCMLSDVYISLNDMTNAKSFKEKCSSLIESIN